MRIIAGKFGGRTFASPNTHHTHPMSDKIRGALFNALGELDDLHVLDAFAGSGALSFEAVSRGADRSTAIENDRSAQQAIIDNINSLDLQSKVKLIKATAQSWLETNPSQSFDIVLLDPPYDHLQRAAVAALAARVNTDGTVVLSWPRNEELPEFEGLACVLHKTYGDAQLGFYQRA